MTALIISIIQALLANAPSIFGLLIAVVKEVHDVEASAAAGGNTVAMTGAEKSAHVIDKVAPIADTVNADAKLVQSMIDGVVTVSKDFKIGLFNDHAGG